MESVALAVRVVAPLFLLIAFGYGMRRAHFADLQFFDRLNDLVFKAFMPVMLFYSVYTSDFYTAFQPKLVMLAVLLVSASFAIGAAVGYTTVHNPSRRGVLIQGSCRTNYVLFGIPMTISLFGSANVGVTAVLIAFVVPLYNVYSTIILEANRGGHVFMADILKAIMTNPLIDATLIAFACIALEVHLPVFLDSVVSDVAQIAAPLAIIVLGGTFRFSRVGGNAKTLFVVALSKLVLLPAFMVGVGVLAGFTGVELGAFLAMSASPTAVGSFSMAQAMGGDGELAGQIVVVTTAASIGTLFIWIFLLSSAGLL